MQNEEKIREALRVFDHLNESAERQNAPPHLVVAAGAVRDVLRWMLEEENDFAEFLDTAVKITDGIDAAKRLIARKKMKEAETDARAAN